MSKKANFEISIRRATAQDMDSIRIMIQELADFEKMSHGPKLATEDLIKDSGLTGQQELFHCYIAEAQSMEPSCPVTRQTIGYALCFFTYSTWEGKTYFLEDLYVRPPYRNLGVGRRLFIEVCRKAKEFGCCRIDFHVLDWNPARKFYDTLGATSLTEKEGWHFYRLTKEKFESIVDKL